MNFSLTYLIGRFVYRVLDFFHHWYVDASKVIFYKLISFLEYLDQAVALKITLKYFFQPLYKDFTYIGRILGVIFRTFRIILGLLLYISVLGVFLVAYAVWLSVPVILIFYVLGAK